MNYVQLIKQKNLETAYLLWYMFPEYEGSFNHSEEKLNEFLKKNYNGVGASYLPKPIRKLLTWYYSKYELAAVIHDGDYVILPKTLEYFHQANKRFFNNCCILNNNKQSIRIWLMFKAVEWFGQSSFFGKKAVEK